MALLLVGTGGVKMAWAHDPDHPEVTPVVELWGPLVSEVSPSSFSLHVGSVDGKARAVTLRVEEAGARPHQHSFVRT